MSGLNVFFLIAVGIVLVQGNCGPCPQPPRIYEELNCTGVREQQGDCCPVRYDCPDLTTEDPTKCHYNGKSYEVGAQLEENPNGCGPHCTCSPGYDSVAAKFNCVYAECPEWLGAPPPARGCTHAYTPGGCCASGQICDAEKSNLHKCSYRGVEKVKGEKFYPPTDPCYVCVCDENFQNDVFVSSDANAKNCKKIECGIQSTYRDRVKQNCAPVYYGDDSCCPSDMICPEHVPNAQIIPTQVVGRESLVCKFGDLKVKFMEGIVTGNKCRECTCLKPPLLTCTHKRNCY